MQDANLILRRIHNEVLFLSPFVSLQIISSIERVRTVEIYNFCSVYFQNMIMILKLEYAQGIHRAPVMSSLDIPQSGPYLDD